MWRPTLHADAHDRAARRAAQVVTVAATVLFTLVVCRWRPWDLFARGGFSTDFYDEQARSFLRAHLSVRPQVAGIEGFLIDGRTYLYYGPFLAIVRLPFALFGDVFTATPDPPVDDRGLRRVLHRLVPPARLRPAMGPGSLERAGCQGRVRRGAPARSSRPPRRSPMLFLTGWVSVYHETEMWAATFVDLDRGRCAAHDRRTEPSPRTGDRGADRRRDPDPRARRAGCSCAVPAWWR